MNVTFHHAFIYCFHEMKLITNHMYLCFFSTPYSDSVELILGTGFAMAFMLAVILHNILPEEDDPRALRDVRTFILRILVSISKKSSVVAPKKWLCLTLCSLSLAHKIIFTMLALLMWLYRAQRLWMKRDWTYKWNMSLLLFMYPNMNLRFRVSYVHEHVVQRWWYRGKCSKNW